MDQTDNAGGAAPGEGAPLVGAPPPRLTLPCPGCATAMVFNAEAGWYCCQSCGVVFNAEAEAVISHLRGVMSGSEEELELRRNMRDALYEKLLKAYEDPQKLADELASGRKAAKELQALRKEISALSDLTIEVSRARTCSISAANENLKKLHDLKTAALDLAGRLLQIQLAHPPDIEFPDMVPMAAEALDA